MKLLVVKKGFFFALYAEPTYNKQYAWAPPVRLQGWDSVGSIRQLQKQMQLVIFWL